MWQEVMAEISARGWRAFVYGPEVHLALPVLYAAVLGIALIIGRGGKKK